MSKISKLIARFAVCAALIAVAVLIDMSISFLPIPLPVQPAIATVLVIITLSQLFDYKSAIFSTTVFGLMSLVFSYILATHPAAIIFQKPWISIIPRILIGLGCYPVFKAFSKLFSKSNNAFIKNILPRSIGAAAGVVINTSMVLLMIWLTGFWIEIFKEIIVTIIAITLLVNFLLELFVALIFVPLISYPVSKRITELNAESLDETVFKEQEK